MNKANNDGTVIDVNTLPEPPTPDQHFDDTLPVEVTPVDTPPADEIPHKPSKRQEIYENIRRRKEAERAEAHPEEDIPEEDVPAVNEPEPAPVEAKKFRLKVNHQDREVTEEELIAAGQQHFAATEALSEAKRLKSELLTALAEVKNSANVQYRPQAYQPGVDEPAADTIPQEDVPKLDLKKIVSDIQLGDEDSGAQALESLVEDIERRILARQEPNVPAHEIATQAVAEMRSQFAAMAANAEFQGKHPEVYQDRRLAAATVLTLNDMCLEEMRDVVGVSNEDLRRVQETPEHIASWHRQYRERGYPVTDARTLADNAVGRAKAELLGILMPKQPDPQPQPAPETAPLQPVSSARPDRTAEKRVEQANNPRRANVIPRPAQQIAKTTADIVAEMRARRRF